MRYDLPDCSPVFLAWTGLICLRMLSMSASLSFLTLGGLDLRAVEPPAPSPSNPAPAKPAVPVHHFFVQRYRIIDGQHLLPRLAIEEAVYPYLGPYRVDSDVEAARGALEKAYHDAGFQTVMVAIPPQQVRAGVVTLQVVPQAVGRLRVTGSRYFDIDQIKREAPSLAEGTVPNFSQVQRDIVGLNQNPDLRVTPVPVAGVCSGNGRFRPAGQGHPAVARQPGAEQSVQRRYQPTARQRFRQLR